MGLRNWGSVTLASLAVFAFAVAGCGSDDESSDNGSSGSTTSSSASGSGKEEAAAKVAELQEIEGKDWPQPDEAFDPGTGRVAVISCGNVGINCLQGSKDTQAAAKAMGWEPSPIFDGEFTPAKQAGYVQQAIQQKYDAIVLVSIDANSIKAAVEAANKAKIPVSCVMCANESFEGDIIDVSTGGVTDGQAIGTYVASQADSGAKIVAYDDKSFPIVAVRRENATAEIEKYCPDCEIENADFPTTDLSKPGPPTFTGMLSSHPSGSLDFVMAPYDPMAIPAAKGAAQQGRDDFKMTGYDASPEYLTLISKGDGVAAATAAVPFPYCSWGAMDQVARVKAGKEPWESNRLPAVLVTAENADQFGKFGFLDPPDFDYKATLQELWGKS
jgi:ABC-type sugar transport system substrate-binding protein